MWNNIKDQKYLTVTKYFFLGIILAVISFRFFTISMYNHKLDFNSIIAIETLKQIIATLIGGLVGGFFIISFIVNNIDKQIKQESFKTSFKEKSTQFFIKNIIAFTIGGFVYTLVSYLFELESSDNLIQTLFSYDLLIDSVGMILAMAVLSILLSVGISKRLYLIHENE